MTRLDVHASVLIDREPTVVRQQFADVAHHERTRLHRGVRFEIIEEQADQCRYLQITRLGPLRLRPALQGSAARALSKAIQEDKRDLEHGDYEP